VKRPRPQSTPAQTTNQEPQDTTNQHDVPDIAGGIEKQKGVEVRRKYVRPVAPLDQITHFTKEMVTRAHASGILPHEILFSIAVDPNLIFTDWIPARGELIPIERTATLAERIQCANAAAPYYAAKKPVEVAHSGDIRVLHALAESALDSVTLDEEGRVIDEDIEFAEIG
jgi:hypothetical protein